MTSAHLSVIPEFQEKIELESHEPFFDIGQTEITNIRSASRIVFRGIKTGAGIQTAALKSIQGLSTWVVDEAEELIDEDVFDKIDESVRQKDVKNRVILILNPASKEHWIFKRFFESVGVNAGFNGIKNRVLYIHTDYRDNIENLSPKFLAKVEQLKRENPDKYNHRILGGWLNKPDGVIYPNWEIGTFDTRLDFGFGLDFGFAVDPDAFIKVAVDKKLKRVYVKQLIYQNGLTTPELIKRMEPHVRNQIIIADNSESRLIRELANAGFNIRPTIKKAGSVIEGIRIVQDYKLIIDPDSPAISRELNNYQWHDKKSESPIDAYNHALDALRYYVQYKTTGVGKYVRETT